MNRRNLYQMKTSWMLHTIFDISNYCCRQKNHSYAS